ncbi:type II secretion system protein F (GspF) [Breoghania corrubedonensis]|uniref:Type II secretion system protein F (GspF) n=1 Tax=Breoghania corrubedonensis TaxID=665038 RepID=A0A2T5VBD3_9HYPH|nr:type II secretion system F family protein [Breoghania corrubedonensis]PTW61054.1 type II secretion system protein F (GspF) [Breoghania corrubedonensis]
MTEFAYKAYSSAGSVVTGEIEADTETAAFATLRDRGLVPVEIAQGQAAPRKAARESTGARDPKLLVRFTRMMASLTSSHVPLLDAVAIARDGERRAPARAALTRVYDAILNGADLSEALERVPGLAPPAYRSLILAGERSGALAAVLSELAGHLEREQETRSRIRAGLLYPSILFATSVAVVLVIATILVPAVAPLFENAGRKTPAIIAFITATKATIGQHWLAVSIGVAIFALVILQLSRMDAVRARLERLVFATPVVSGLKANIEIARFCRTLGTMLRNGVSLEQALETTKGTLSSRSYRATIAKAISGIRNGESFASELEEAPHVPMIARRMVRIGEETGTLPDMLDHIGKVLEAEAGRQIQLVFQLVPPVMTLAIGLGVGSFILVIMDAVLSVNDLAF